MSIFSDVVTKLVDASPAQLIGIISLAALGLCGFAIYVVFVIAKDAGRKK